MIDCITWWQGFVRGLYSTWIKVSLETTSKGNIGLVRLGVMSVFILFIEFILLILHKQLKDATIYIDIYIYGFLF